MSDLLEKNIFFVCLWKVSQLLMPHIESLQLLFAQSLFTKEQPWPIRSFSRAKRSFAHKNERFPGKAAMREFPTLVYTRFSSYTHCNVDTYKDSIRDLKFCRGSPLIEFLRNILLNLFLVCYCFIILDRKITDQQYVSVVTFPVLVSNRQLAIWFCVALFLIYARHNWQKVSLCYPWQASECQLYLIHVLIWLANHCFEQDDEAVQCATTPNHPSC